MVAHNILDGDGNVGDDILFCFRRGCMQLCLSTQQSEKNVYCNDRFQVSSD